MTYAIERINESFYPLFEDMVFWRENGCERAPSASAVLEDVQKELCNPNLYLYAARVDNRYVGWISLLYLPKVGKWKGHGHVYVDELWVAPPFRRMGLAKALLAKADELKDALQATGIRLYVNVLNDGAHALYASCGFQEDGQAWFMEK